LWINGSYKKMFMGFKKDTVKLIVNKYHTSMADG